MMTGPEMRRGMVVEVVQCAVSSSRCAHARTQTGMTGIDISTVEAGQKALRVFFRIAGAWGLTASEQMTLLGVGGNILVEWQAGRLTAGLDRATSERLSHLFGIYSALQVLLPIPEHADAWIKRPNLAPLFNGQTALQQMLGGQVSDLLVVREYLDGELDR